MTFSPDVGPNTATPHLEVAPDQRKVRKGTRSCWECKRRKIRCVFPPSGDTVCIPCDRRRSPCVSQEMPETLSPARKASRHLGNRIARVENVVKSLLATKEANSVDQVEADSSQHLRCSNPDIFSPPSRNSTPMTVCAPPVPTETPDDYAQQLPSFLSPDLPGPSRTDPQATALHPLRAAFPAVRDIQILLKESARSSRYMGLLNTQPHSKLTHEILGAPYSPAEIPGLNTHPVLLARHMLIFAITLQSPHNETFQGLSESLSVLGRRWVTAATTFLTADEEAQCTVEGLVCIILGAVYETNCGNLRRAWMIYRRAMTVAQIMGLHRSPTPPLRRLDPVIDADPDFLWFRIVYMDRYLSLLLGLPQGSIDRSIAAGPVLQREPPLGQFERSLTAIATSILERNERAFAMSEIATTRCIDRELLDLSKSMPSSFWRLVNFQNLVAGSPENLLEIVRLSAQVYYYGLLIQLHLPYMMSETVDYIEHEYSRITCVNASREIMTRFIAHRTCQPKLSCSRPVDFFALLAAMTILLAHLDSHHHREATNLLAHQRLSDRAMLNQALETMDVMLDIGKDVIIEKSAELIRRLLDIEADAENGNDYTAQSVGREEEDMEPGIEKRDADLRLHIPYLGVIRIARQGPICRESPSDAASTWQHKASRGEFMQNRPVLVAAGDTLTCLHHTAARDKQGSSEVLQTRDQDQFSLETLPVIGPQDMQMQTSEGDELCVPQLPKSSQNPVAQASQAELPSMTAGIDDWIFQGVDTAFFDSLMRTNSYVDMAGLE